MIPVKIATAFTYQIGPFVSSTDGVTPTSALAMVTSDIRLSKNGAGWISKSTATTPVHTEHGYLTATFTATDFETQGITRLGVCLTSAGGALAWWKDFFVTESSDMAVALSSAARTTAIDLIWDEPTTGHGTAGVAGASLAFPTSGVSISATGLQSITTAVWAELYAGHTTAGSYGLLMGTNLLTPTSGVRLSATGIDQIWDEPTTGHGAVGTVGASLAFPTSGVSISATGLQSITTAVWAELYAGHTTAGSYGLLMGTNLLSPTSGVTIVAAAQTALVTAVTTSIWAEALASHTTAGAAGKKLYDAAMSTDMISVLTASSAIFAASSGIQAKTTNLPATPASSTDAMRLATTAIDLIWDELMAGHLTTDMAGERLNAAAANAGLGTTATRDAVWNAVRATYATVGSFGEVAVTSDVVDAIWDEPTTGHGTTNTMGERLFAASAGASTGIDPWGIATTNVTYTSTQFGGRLDTLVSSRASSTAILAWSMSSDMGTALTNISAIKGATTNLPATPASSTSFLNWAMSTDMATALSNITAIKGATTTLPLSPASSTSFLNWSMSTDMGTALTALAAIEGATTTLPLSPASATGFTGLMSATGSTAMADAVWDKISESTQTHADQIRTMRATLAGKASGGGTATIAFKDAADTIDRITFTATTEGNRTAVVLVTT